jgi:phosphoribulokinase
MKKVAMFLVMSAILPFGANANDYSLVEQCFVENHANKAKVSELENKLAQAEAELNQYKNDYPGTAVDTSVGAEELDQK